MNDEGEAEMIGLVAPRHGIVLDRHDPRGHHTHACSTRIERALRQAGSDQAAHREEMHGFMGETQAAAMTAIEKELASIVARIREEMRRDLLGPRRARPRWSRISVTRTRTALGDPRIVVSSSVLAVTSLHG
jgi:hypothetical protein